MMPDCSWDEVIKNRGHIIRGNISYFISRLPCMGIPLCLQGSGHFWDTPKRSDTRRFIRRFLDTEDENIITFTHETFCNAVEHGHHRKDGSSSIGSFPSIVFDEQDELIITIQDLGVGIEAHRALNKPQYDRPQLGLEKIKKVAGPTLKIELDEIGMSIQARFPLPNIERYN